MRAAPAVEVVVSRFGVWRAGLWALGSAGVVTPWWWLLDRAASAGPWLWCVAVAASALCGLSVSAVCRVDRSFALHWNSQHWSVAMGADETDSGVKACRSPVTHATRPMRGARFARGSVQGEVSVVVDVGSWMLLRFDTLLTPPNPEAANATNDVNLQTPEPTNRDTPRRLWLPLQRAGLEPQWHALRCALHSRASSDLEASRLLNTRQSA